MSKRSGKYKEYKQDFLLDEPKLRKLVDVIRHQAGKLEEKTHLELLVQKEDNAYYTTEDPEEVLADDNAEGKAIQALLVELHREENKDVSRTGRPSLERTSMVALAFTPKREARISVSVTNDRRDWIFLTMDELDAQIRRTLKGSRFRILSIADPLLALLAVYVGLVIGFWGVFNVALPQLSSQQIAAMTMEQQVARILENQSRGFSAAGYMFMGLFSLAWVAGTVIFIFSPVKRLLSITRTSFFLWGDMENIYRRVENRNTLLKWSLGVALVISIVGSITGTLIMTR